MSRVLAVASGKGGTGKTSISVNLSLCLGRSGHRVCLLDADLGLSNVDVLLGITPERTLEHVLFEGVPMEQALIPVAPGVDVIPGGSGVSRLADLPRRLRTAIAAEFGKLSGYDFMVVDSSPGISSQVIALCLACPELLVVINPDPASITDAYALVKVLSENGMRRSPYLLVNKASSGESAKNIFTRVRGTMLKYLKMDARYLGYIPQDIHVSAAAARQRPLMDLYPTSNAGLAILGLAQNLDKARLPLGVAQADPTLVMEGALVRMREATPKASNYQQTPEVRKTLDAAISLTSQLLENPQEDQAAVVARLKTLLLKVRNGMKVEGSKPRPCPHAQAVRVTVISSDPSISELLIESLDAAGLAVNPDDRRADVAVVYWPSSQDISPRALEELGTLQFVYLRSLTSKALPQLGRTPAEVLDLPFKLEDLAGAVRKCATRPRGRSASVIARPCRLATPVSGQFGQKPAKSND